MAINPLQFQAFGLNAPKRTKLSIDQFDPAAYLAANSDVASAIQNGQFTDAWQHYDLHGSNEMSRPWALRNNYSEGDYMRIVTPEGNISGGGGIGAPDWIPGVTQYDPTKDPYSGVYTGAPIGGINPVGTFQPPPVTNGGTSSVPFNPVPGGAPAAPPANPTYGGGSGYTFNPVNMTLPNQFNSMDLPQYQGPLSAPITEGMFNATQGIKNTLEANPVGQSTDLMAAISRMLSGEGTTSSDPNQAIGQFDNTDIYKNLKTVFEGDLADQTAELQEQFSGLGLGVGSTDRLNRIAGNAGNARARFGAEMGAIESASFENAMNRLMADRELRDRSKSAALSAGVAARGQDIDVYGQKMQGANNLFNAESILRGMADEEVMRAYQEFARTQGGAYQQMLAYLNSLPEGTVSVGPSTASQGADIIGSVMEYGPEFLEWLKNR